MKFDLLTQSEVNEHITQIATTAKALQSQIHVCAVSTLAHTAEHGDYRGVAALLNALPNGQRVKALVAWYTHFSDGALVIKKAENGAGFAVSLKSGWKDKCSIDVESAADTTYADFTKERTPTPMTVEKLIKWLQSKADDVAGVEESARAVAAKLVASYNDAVKKSLEVAA